jgi:hypothetical protein
MSSEKARKTRTDPNFCKMAITETRENENFGKSRLSQGPKIKAFQKRERRYLSYFNRLIGR